MSTLDILSNNDREAINRVKQNYHQWFRTDESLELPTDYFLKINLPKGREEETLRQIMVDARLKEKLAFRFWWAAKLDDGKTSLFLSLKDANACDQFSDICDRHCAHTLG